MTTDKVQKTTEDGKLLFLFPMSDLEVKYEESRTVKVTTKKNNAPAMISVKVPMLDLDGSQMSYETTRTEYEQIPFYDEDENIIGYTDGESKQVGTGQFLLLWTTEMQQEVNDAGKLLYWGTEVEEKVRYEPQDPIEITEDDERYVEGLEPVYIDVAVEETEPPTVPVYESAETKIAKLEKRIEEQLQKTIDDTTNTQLALAETYEQLLKSEDETTNTQLALIEIFEQLLVLQESLIPGGE